MKTKFLVLICALSFLFGVVLPQGLESVQAQPAEPPILEENHQPCLTGRACQDEQGLWYASQDKSLVALDIANTREIGGPDDFGYTWDDSVSYGWIDASVGGTNAGITNEGIATQAITLPFDFPFYENTYSQIYITGSGYITFEDYDYVRTQSEIPNQDEPNNVVAPFWVPAEYDNSSKVYYKSGGTAPDRYFIVEWLDLINYFGGSFTFEVLLYENGNIKFQYNEITSTSGSLYCADAGIEDSAGLDGLSTGVWCANYPLSNTAVLFTRPPDERARVKATPPFDGKFAAPEQASEFILTVSNLGTLGADIFDINVTSAWPVTILDAFGENPLTDTDGDSILDTGAIAQGGSMEVLVRITPPAGLDLGDENTASISFTSSIDIAVTRTALLDLAIPAPFAQSYAPDYNASLDLARPEGQISTSMPWADTQIEPAIAETPAHNQVMAWGEWLYIDNAHYGYILKYSIIDRLGQVIVSPTSLTTLYLQANSYTRDQSISVAVAPDGKIGVAWVRYIINHDTGKRNYNVWFAALSPNGSLAHGPINLTNNTTWGVYPTYKIFSDPIIAASEDNRFLISYYFKDYSINATRIFYTIRSTNADLIKAPTLVASYDGSDRYLDNLALTNLDGNRFLLIYEKTQRSPTYVYELRYKVYDSSGGLLVDIPSTRYENPGYVDVVQLSGGNIFIAYTESGWSDTMNWYILSGSDFTLLYYSDESPVHPSSGDYLYNLSVTRDNQDHAVITWTDENYYFLYYALISGDGTVLTDPVIFKKADYLSLNYNGFASTTNSWEPAPGVDLFSEFIRPLYAAAPGGLAGVKIRYANQGTDTATNTQMSLTLADELVYDHDTCPVTPTQVGNTLTWDLGDLAFAEGESCTVYVTVPGLAVPGTLFDIGLSISSDETDADLSNNSDSAQVLAALMTFLPLIMR